MQGHGARVTASFVGLGRDSSGGEGGGEAEGAMGEVSWGQVAWLTV